MQLWTIRKSKLNESNVMDLDFIHAAFLVHDDEVLCEKAPDEVDTIVITFSSI
jgi:hypothetical protein